MTIQNNVVRRKHSKVLGWGVIVIFSCWCIGQVKGIGILVFIILFVKRVEIFWKKFGKY